MAEALHCPGELVGQGYGLIDYCLGNVIDARRCGFECMADRVACPNEPFPEVEHSVLSVRSYYDEPGKRRAIYLLFFCNEEAEQRGIAQQFYKVIRP